MKKVLIVGGGPAGMMAAISAAENENDVTLVEKNEELGKKLLITGNGRCNITNDKGPEEMLSHIERNERFLRSSFFMFKSHDIIALLNSRGLKTKVEENGRVFPKSDKAEDVRDALIGILKEKKVNLIKGCAVKELIIEEGICRGVRTEGKEFKADITILCSGGLAAPFTGSDGIGIKMARAAGHTITEPFPALSPIELKGSWWKELQGITLRGARLSSEAGLSSKKGKKKLEARGDMIFTHFGISGPAAIKMSSLWGKERSVSLSEERLLYLDIIPEIAEGEIDGILINAKSESGNKLVKTLLQDYAPKDMISCILDSAGVPYDRKLAELTKEERREAVECLKRLPLEVKGVCGFKRAMVTSGGISTKEINPKTMESKLIKNLRFAGEIIDVDAETGGYNLQIAWSTGWAAGNI